MSARHDAVAVATTKGEARFVESASLQQQTDTILKTFNTWAFKREQPSDLGLLKSVVGRAVTRGEPIPFVLYWGKGPRRRLASPDVECLDYLRSMAERINGTYAPGARLHLILTDTHARHNGHDEASIASYFADIEAAASADLFRCERLSSIVASTPRPDRVPLSPDNAMLTVLMRSAAKWYRGALSIEEGARAYFAMNMIEREAVEARFPFGVFATFNGRESRPLFPESMPIFYMYSLRKGFAVKPWFLDAGMTAHPQQGHVADPCDMRSGELEKGA